MKNLPKPILYFLRLSITIGAIWLAFSYVPVHEVMPLLTSIPWPYLLIGLLLVHIGQIISALRTRYYLHCEQIDLSVKPSLKLHYVGGVFNAFLPGGAGGDAYKAWWLKHHRQGRLLDMMKLMIASRLNGLWALGILLCLLAYGSEPILQSIPHAGVLMAMAAICGTLCYGAIAWRVLHEPLRQQAHAAFYSMALQGILVSVAFVLCRGLGLREHALEYSLLFMLSCILAMLPISIGGIGVRELALLHGSKVLGLSEHSGVTLAFAFTLLFLTIPLAGAIIHHLCPPEKDS